MPATDFQVVVVAATDATILLIAKIVSDSSSIALHPLHTNFTGATLVGYFSVVVYQLCALVMITRYSSNDYRSSTIELFWG